MAAMARRESNSRSEKWIFSWVRFFVGSRARYTIRRLQSPNICTQMPCAFCIYSNFEAIVRRRAFMVLSTDCSWMLLLPVAILLLLICIFRFVFSALFWMFWTHEHSRYIVCQMHSLIFLLLEYTIIHAFQLGSSQSAFGIVSISRVAATSHDISTTL